MLFKYYFIFSFLFVLINGQGLFGGCGIRPPFQLPQLQLPCPTPIAPIVLNKLNNLIRMYFFYKF